MILYLDTVLTKSPVLSLPLHESSELFCAYGGCAQFSYGYAGGYVGEFSCLCRGYACGEGQDDGGYASVACAGYIVDLAFV